MQDIQLIPSSAVKEAQLQGNEICHCNSDRSCQLRMHRGMSAGQGVSSSHGAANTFVMSRNQHCVLQQRLDALEQQQQQYATCCCQHK
jgi:hypothetical protein